ncbi:nucleotide sugar dehydrogenase [Paenibacillus algicola]|uniref:UDP-glucose 6-dehydrogenase n=1 Tax=Paenibacillus algicola TaxID=2565926 RepID=A0A4V1G3N8_9BACL|nr:UDP-glucose/GDP-mannose dehydrogenase family protein [Paenibacillus algicola]QCT01844.1 nucleotide sugar dehydrogenase [Paenibacillus algicola]
MKTVCLGTGYVGTVTAAALAMAGHQATVIDIDKQKVNSINAGASPIFEPGLNDVISLHAGRLLTASVSLESVREADVIFICVGTPALPDGTADLRYVKDAARSIGENLSLERFTVIVNKSTVPVGTAALVASIVESVSGGEAERHFTVASNPEFLREGYALEDVLFPDRIIVGTQHPEGLARLRELYKPYVKRLIRIPDVLKPYLEGAGGQQETVYFETDTKSAELIKYASNAFLAVKISYINEIARLSEALGANTAHIARGMGLDSRIGEKFLEVSSGWSGSCFPKDTQELWTTSRKYGAELSIVRAAMDSNEEMKHFCVRKLQRKLKSLNGSCIGLLGLTFKPNTDDVRETQALFMIRQLLELGAQVRVHDPKGMDHFRRLYPDLPVDYCESAEEAAERTHALVLMTHWEQYLQLNWKMIFYSVKQPYILDTRNCLRGAELREMGFDYEGIG